MDLLENRPWKSEQTQEVIVQISDVSASLHNLFGLVSETYHNILSLPYCTEVVKTSGPNQAKTFSHENCTEYISQSYIC